MATILIADPDPANRSLLELLLVRLGHRPIREDELAAGEEPALLLLEPASRAGLGLARNLRRHFPRLPIVCVSIDGPTEDSRRLDPVVHVMKPFRRKQLEAALTLAFRGPDLRATA